MNRKRSILISLTGITVVTLALLGLTYGYYITNIIGNTNSNSIAIDTKDLKLEYDDGTQDLVFGAIEPGWSNSDTPKVFTVNNTGKSDVDEYVVGIDEVINTLNRTQDLTYTITCKSYLSSDYKRNGKTAAESGVCRGDSGEFPKENKLILTNSINSGYIQVYEMIISYEYLDDINQSIDMGSSIGGRIQIYTLPDTIDISGTVTNYEDGDYVEISSPNKTSRIVDGKYKLIGIEPGNYTLSIKYVDSNEVVQTRSSKQISVRMGEDVGVSDNTITMNSTSGNVTINLNASSSSLGTDITGVGEHTKLLKDVIIANTIKNTNTNSTTGTIYSPTPLTTPGGSVNNSNEKTLSITEDDYGASYYFRGNVIDNYVNFSGMCWRIVRVQGDGTIKLILADGEHECGLTTGYNLESASSGFISNSDGIIRTDVVYKDDLMWNISDLIFEDSNIPDVLLNWINIKNINVSKLSVSNWCNDTAYTEDSSYYFEDFDAYIESMDYASYSRLNISSPNPTLKCNTIGLDNTTSTIYQSNIGVLTADEVAYAGAMIGAANLSYYLSTNATGSSYWTMSPASIQPDLDSQSNMFIVTNQSRLGFEMAWYTSAVRPVVVLEKNTSVKMELDKSIYGEPGTYSNPYVIE